MDKLTEVVWPVVIDNRGDLIAFRSLADADDEIEIIDVDNGEFVAYDALGRLLALGSEKGKVTVELAETEPTRLDEIRQQLSRTMKYLRVPIERGIETPLMELIVKLLEEEEEREKRWWR